MPTKCDILRAGAAAVMQTGVCGGATPPPDCYTTDLATKRDMYFQTKYAPSGLISGISRDIRAKELGILQTSINTDSAQLKTKYGADAPTGVSWNEFTQCLWRPDGSRGGPHNNKYFERNDLVSLGYQPQPLFGAAILEGKIPPTLTNKIPVWLDRVFNPALAVVVIFLLLAVVLAVLVYKARKWAQQAPERAAAAKEAWRKKMEAHDPYRGTPFETYPADPNTKWEQLIPVYEAEGFCMEEYRKKMGMPVTDHCAAN